MKYDNLIKRAQGLACILGPLLGVIATLVFVAGNQAMEGVIGYYGMILFIPAYFAMAWIIGQRMPTYGLVCAILGLLGGVAGVFAMAMRIVYIALLRADLIPSEVAGDFDTASEALFTSHPEMMVIGIIALFWPLTHILNGIGLIRVGGSLRWSGVLLIAGGVSFLTAQALLIALEIFYPLAMILLLAGLAPIGWRLWRGGPSEFAAIDEDTVTPSYQVQTSQ